MAGNSTPNLGTAVFCQIAGREISPESCLQTQGQEGCFGCASPIRKCEKCPENLVAVAATGTCSRCTAEEISYETNPVPREHQPKVYCQMLKYDVSIKACEVTQGQAGCKGCKVSCRICETCTTLPVVFPAYGLCFTCSVKEFGEGWTPEVADRAAPKLHVEEEVPRDQSNGLRHISLDHIQEPEDGVREHYDEEELRSLADSLESDGVISPVVLEPLGDDRYEVIVGSRRTRAARLGNKKVIPALILEKQTPLAKLILALAENLHRVNLDPFEEGKTFLRLLREYGLDVGDIATKIKRSDTYIKERIQILTLPDEVRALVRQKNLDVRKAALLVRLPDSESQKALAEEVVTHDLNHGELLRKIQAILGEEVHNQPERVLSRIITPQKFEAKSGEFTTWLTRAISCLARSEMSDEEGNLVLEKLDGIIKAVRAEKKKFATTARVILRTEAK